MSAASWLNGNVFGGTVNGPGGALTGAPSSDARLVHNPDGSATDPATGQTYAYTPGGISPTGVSTNGGYTAMSGPNTIQQVGTDANAAQGFLNNVPQYNQREGQAYGQEQGVANSLNSMAMGQGPTVAGQQMQVGLDQAARTQMAGAAGASGSGAVLSRMAAMNNTANAQMQTNQQQGVARAGEQTNALNQLAGVTNNMANQSQGMGQQQINAAQGLNALAMNGAVQNSAQQIDANKAEAQNNKDAANQGIGMVKSGIGALTSLF